MKYFLRNLRITILLGTVAWCAWMLLVFVLLKLIGASSLSAEIAARYDTLVIRTAISGFCGVFIGGIASAAWLATNSPLEDGRLRKNSLAAGLGVLAFAVSLGLFLPWMLDAERLGRSFTILILCVGMGVKVGYALPARTQRLIDRLHWREIPPADAGPAIPMATHAH